MEMTLLQKESDQKGDYNMPITSNTINNDPNRSGNMGATAARRTFRTGNSTITLREGETLKGVVSDVHGNEITISLDDGTSFTGHLSEASMYSIGQKAAFLITSLDNGTIYMKAMSSTYLLGMEDTIEQALEEAGLPKSPRNLDIVRSLLENKQSISRESINTFMQLCSRYPNADVGNVITMYRLGFPMDEASVTQFDTYQNQQHEFSDGFSDRSSLGTFRGKCVPCPICRRRTAFHRPWLHTLFGGISISRQRNIRAANCGKGSQHRSGNFGIFGFS